MTSCSFRQLIPTSPCGLYLTTSTLPRRFTPPPSVTPPLRFPPENEPPTLPSLPFQLRSFQGENFVYQLRASDPEGSAVLFTLESGPEGASLSPAGLLMWTASAETTDTHTFYFTVTDECNAETRAATQVVLTLEP